MIVLIVLTLTVIPFSVLDIVLVILEQALSCIVLYNHVVITVISVFSDSCYLVFS